MAVTQVNAGASGSHQAASMAGRVVAKGADGGGAGGDVRHWCQCQSQW